MQRNLPLAVLTVCLALPLPAAAQASCLKDALGTLRCNDGGSYRVDGLGVVRDLTGRNVLTLQDADLPNDLIMQQPEVDIEITRPPVPEMGRSRANRGGCSRDVLGNFSCD